MEVILTTHQQLGNLFITASCVACKGSGHRSPQMQAVTQRLLPPSSGIPARSPTVQAEQAGCTVCSTTVSQSHVHLLVPRWVSVTQHGQSLLTDAMRHNWQHNKITVWQLPNLQANFDPKLQQGCVAQPHKLAEANFDPWCLMESIRHHS